MSAEHAAEVRAAEPADIEELLEAYEWLFAPPGSKPHTWEARRSAEALREAIESRDAAVLVATASDGAIVGFVTGYLDLHSVRFGPRCWVEDFAVDPPRRSHGVGKRLLEAIKGWAGERGATHLELDSGDARTNAHRFYEREGGDGGSRSFHWSLTG
ncbi:MAG: GNAT family N-acetyltransferase [Solirubrobacterales bacterium]